jgi:hypothetical protein
MARFPRRQHRPERPFLRQQIIDVVGVENIGRDPMQEVKVAQRAPPLLDVRFDEKGAVAVAAMALGALRLLDADSLAS